MRIQNRVGGGFAALAVVVAGVAVVDLDPTVITQLATGADGVWVPVDTTGEVVRVDTVSGEVTARVALANEGSRLDVRQPAGESDDVVVVDRATGTVMAVDPVLHRVDRSVATGLGEVQRVDMGDSGVAVATGSSVVHVDADISTSQSMTAPEDVTSIALDGDGAAVALSASIVTLAGLDVDERETEIEDPVVVRAGDDVLWSDGELVRGLDGGRNVCLASRPSATAEWMGHPSGLVAVADGARGVVQILDVNTGSCRDVDIVDPGTDLGRPGIALGVVFVPEPGRGLVHIIDPSSPRFALQAPVSFPGSRLEIHTRDELVVAHDPLRSVGAVLDAEGVVTIVETSPPSQTGLRTVVEETGPAGVPGGGADTPVVGHRDATGTPGDSRLDAALLDATVLSVVVDAPQPEPDQPLLQDLVASFAFSTDVALVGQSVQFVDESSGGPTSWIWDFGDGSGAEGPIVETSWATPGTYAVTLFVQRGAESDQVTAPITVVVPDTAIPPSADFSFSTTAVAVGDPVLFNDLSTGEVNRRRWEFGDGTTSESKAPTKTWTAAGNYTVTLTVANELGSDSTSVSIEVVDLLEPPVAVIDVAALEFEAGAPVTFEGSSAGGTARFDWAFGDGLSGTGPSVTHVYGAPGSYTVQLRASNDAGTDLEEIDITIVEPTLVPVAAIAAVPPVIEVGDEVTLTSLSTNAPETESWEFGDGMTDEGTTVDHAWSAPGVYVVTLSAVNQAGADTATVTVTVLEELPPPVAAFRSPDSTRAGDTVLFVDESTNPTSWSWTFGDGSLPVTTQDALHTFTTEGPTTVTLTVSNRNGESTATATVTVLPPLPVADFFFTPTTPGAGSPVDFIDASSNAVSWEWDFGDGSPIVTSRNPVHTFSSAGPYGVTLTVRNPSGDVDTQTKTVDVDPPPPVLNGIDATPTTGTTGLPTTFSASTFGGPIASWEWSIDGSPVGTDPFLAHTFAVAGSYTVAVTATGPGGSDAASISYTVVDPPPPNIVFGPGAVVPAVPEVGETVAITATVQPGSGPIDSWSWTIDGVSVAGSGPSLTTSFPAPGPYIVAAIATGPVASDTATTTITVVNPPSPIVNGIDATPTTGTTGLPTTFSASTSGGPITSWAWSIDGSPVGTDPSLAHTFAVAGSYTVAVTATGPGGSDVASISYTAVDPPIPTTPVPSNPTPAVGDPVTFTSSPAAGSGPISSWAWQVNGVPVTGSGPSLATSFATAGTFTITVIATGPSGETGTASLAGFVVAPAAPVAEFSWTIPTPLQVSFTDLSSPGVATWSWDFGDAGTSTEPNPTHVYAAAGTYVVALTVTSPGGSASISHTVLVS